MCLLCNQSAKWFVVFLHVHFKYSSLQLFRMLIIAEKKTETTAATVCVGDFTFSRHFHRWLMESNGSCGSRVCVKVCTLGATKVLDENARPGADHVHCGQKIQVQRVALCTINSLHLGGENMFSLSCMIFKHLVLSQKQSIRRNPNNPKRGLKKPPSYSNLGKKTTSLHSQELLKGHVWENNSMTVILGGRATGINVSKCTKVQVEDLVDNSA